MRPDRFRDFDRHFARSQRSFNRIFYGILTVNILMFAVIVGLTGYVIYQVFDQGLYTVIENITRAITRGMS